jgi:two-component system osmolarity sensor histidine kinase EnvZ
MFDSLTKGPSSLLTRTNLTLGVSSMLIVVIATIALYGFVINPIADRSADDEAALIVLSAQTWVELGPAARVEFELEMAIEHDFIISGAREDLPVLDSYFPYVDLVREKLSARLGREVTFLDDNDIIWVDVPMGGHDLQIGMSPDRRGMQPLYVAIVIVGMGAAIVFGTSLFIVQRITRPLVKVAEQAEEFRGARDIEPLAEEGPRELISLARNFNTMAQEISTLVANRTTLLAGISHDLRTPLTRMRLALELLPDSVDTSLVERFERNLESMDELISDALRFARGTGEVAQEIELLDFVKDVLASFEQPVELFADLDPANRVFIAPSAFRRVLINLVSNGFKHGKNVSVRLSESVVRVIDDGPGIPAEYREQVFQPFFRLDQSRSQLTGGSGLGLAIVQQLCEAHGWRIGIEDGDSSAYENGENVENRRGTAVWLAFT